MPEYDTSNNKLIFRLKDDKGRIKKVDLSSLRILEDWEILIPPLCRWNSGARFYSKTNRLHSIKTFLGDSLNQLNQQRLPHGDEEWQTLVLRLYELALSRSDIKMNLKTRCQAWARTIAPFFKILRDQESIIPESVEIPKPPVKLELVDYSSFESKLIGEASVGKPEQNEEDKLLVSVSLGRTDAEYLDFIRHELTYRRTILHNCLLTWWQQIRDHYHYGQKLIDQTNYTELKSKLDAGDRTIGTGKGGLKNTGRRLHHIASGKTEESLGNLLSILTVEHQGRFSTSLECQYLPKTTYRFNIPESAPTAIQKTSPKQRINWMLGNFSNFDIAIIRALITMHNPQFTSFSLRDAKLYSKNGYSYLELSDQGQRFRIEKHRAKAIKEWVHYRFVKEKEIHVSLTQIAL